MPSTLLISSTTMLVQNITVFLVKNATTTLLLGKLQVFSRNKQRLAVSQHEVTSDASSGLFTADVSLNYAAREA